MKNKTFYNMNLFASISLFFGFSSCDGIVERNKKPLDPEYVNFQEINEKYNSDNFEVKLFCETQISGAASPNPIRIFSSVNNQLIVSCDAEKNDETQGDMLYYKVRSNGSVADTLSLNQNKYWPEFIDNFIVFTNNDGAYYNTWPLNGDTTQLPFHILNADLHWSEEKVNQKIEQIKKEGKYWFFNNVTNNDTFYMQFFFYQGNQWYLLWQKLPAYRSLDSSETANRYRQDIFWTGDVDPYRPNNITFLHFHPEEKLKYSHNIGGGSGGYSVTNWRGKVFFKTKIGDRDFKFFTPNIAVENEKFDDFKNRYYTVIEASYPATTFRQSFYISTHGFAFYSSHGQSMYIIRDKTVDRNTEKTP